MHKKSKVLIAVAAAGLVAVGGSAFTDSNTGMQDDIVGYSTSDTAGVTVTNTANNLSPTDKSLLAEIVYTVQENVSVVGDHESWLVITSGGVEGSPIACTASYTDDLDPGTADGTITCDTNDIPVADVNSVSLTVTTP